MVLYALDTLATRDFDACDLNAESLRLWLHEICSGKIWQSTIDTGHKINIFPHNISSLCLQNPIARKIENWFSGPAHVVA